MRPPARLFLLIAAVVLTAPAAFSADRFTTTQQRIEAMLGQRIKPTPLPASLPNPFATGLPKQVIPETPGVVVQDDDHSILLRFASTLRVSGVVRIADTPHLVINSSPYKEGDLLQIRDTDPPEYVRIVRILPRELTLSYNTATIRVPLP